MVAPILTINAVNPEPRRVARVAQILREGGIALYPTDTMYALGCDPHNADALKRLRALGGDEQRLLTVICRSLSEVSHYAYIEDRAFKLIKALTPGPYTFILEGTKEMPRLVLNPKRRTAGVRIPGCPICMALLNELDGLLVSTSARLPDGEPPDSIWDLFDAWRGLIDIIVDDEGPLPEIPSTVIDMTTPAFEIIREGKGLEALLPFMKTEAVLEKT
jgi:tRNA threonylcarbamoyl adenosine modification protein (Sua5/YciO/YrdC/YwlC family)